MHKKVLAGALLASGLLIVSTADAQERLCDASAENCRTTLVDLINNEQVGIDVGVWFFKDDRFVTALVSAKNRGVPIRMLMDPRANATYAQNSFELAKVAAAGIPMRKRTAGDILHWKLMIFAGQGVVEWSGANFSPSAFVPQVPYGDYEDEVIYFSHALVQSFMTVYDNIWTNTTQYANYANITTPLVRIYPTFAIDARLSFPPKDSYQDRLVPLIDKEPAGGLIDVDMYRLTMARPVDALIRAAARGVRQRLYFEPNEYANLARPGNKVQIDRLVAAAKTYPGTIEIRMRAHLGLNHQKTVWLHAQHIVVFGTSNWSDASDDNQLEANIFTDRLPGDPLNDFLFAELNRIFVRKWTNGSPTGSVETVAYKTPTLPPPPLSDLCLDPAASNYGGALPCVYPPPPPPPPPLPDDAKTVVIWANSGTPHGSWQLLADSSAAGGSGMWNPNANKAKIAPAQVTPANYVEMTFPALANVPYHVWIRLRAEGDSTGNDSVHLQFGDSVTATGGPLARIGTTNSAEFVLQDGDSDPSVHGWGWTGNGWNTLGPPVYFAATGTHTVRMQQREDGAIVDQIVLSPDTYTTSSPGARDDDGTILPATTGAPPPPPPTCTDPAATNFGGPLPCVYPLPPDAKTVVMWASSATPHGTWRLLADSSAAGGSAMWNPNAGAAKISPAKAAPVNYMEMTFPALANVPYHLWIRLRAEGNSTGNDSVHLQFNDSVTATGAPLARIGTTGSAEFVLQDGDSDPGISGWGWADNGWNQLGPPVYFAAAGTHTVRVQQREDGAIVDQIVISPDTYVTRAPGTRDNDTTILPATTGAPPPPPPTCTDPTATNFGGPLPCTYPPSASGDILLHPADATVIVGNWVRQTDATAATGASLVNPDRVAAKIATASAAPADYFEMTFTAVANTPYRLWIRGKAARDFWGNDSVFAQFSGSTTAAGAAVYRIGTASGSDINLEDCGDCGLAGWGWQDNGWGVNVPGPLIYFAASGPQTLRVQTREDGLAIDQILLSPQTYLTAAPGLLKNDTTILP
jgi:phosphatidylserine/phosphatidylglycerophosphate/cardiolipin synthase-like enzyme